MKNTAEAPPFSIGRVAVVEGDRTAAEMLHMFFRLMDIESVVIPPAEGAEEATAATICREGVDAVLLDFDLPNLRALEIASRIRVIQPFLPIILTTRNPASVLPPLEAVALTRKPNERFEELLRLMEVLLEAF
ncbi:MAG TPA: response regulator [Thermoanaerobaculia bacterium]|jgi:DNA-binding response OmpR family regulator|nr:response regulator [Thermoanaerobaculia bacterium]